MTKTQEQDSTDEPVTVEMDRESWNVVIHVLEEQMDVLQPEEIWIGGYPGEDDVTAMKEAHQEIIEDVMGGD